MYPDISMAEKRKLREGVFSCIGPEGFDSVALRNGFNFPSDTPEWIAVLEDSIFHLTTELLCTESERAAYLLHRVLEAFGHHDFSVSVSMSAFGSTCRSTVPSYPSIIDKFLAIKGVDPFGTIRDWPCSCSSTCVLARKMCVGRVPVELAVHGMNNTALQQIYSTISERFLDSRFLSPVFRQNPRFPMDQVTKVRGIISAVFSESDNSEIFSVAKLLATLEDGRAGILPSLPIEEIGLHARSARDLLPNLNSLDGASSILFLVAGTKDTVAGRDVIFRFLLDMRVSPTVVNKQNQSLLEFAFRENLSFWTSQSRTVSSPALAIEGKVDVPPAVFRHFVKFLLQNMLEVE